MINGKYIQYSRIFHTFPENNRTGYLPEKTHAVPTCRWGGVLPAVSVLEYSSLQRECTEFPYAIPLWVDAMIVPKEDCFVEYTKPPVVRKAKPGSQAQSIISLMKIRNPNALPTGNKFGFFLYGGRYRTRLDYGVGVVEPPPSDSPQDCHMQMGSSPISNAIPTKNHTPRVWFLLVDDIGLD